MFLWTDQKNNVCFQRRIALGYLSISLVFDLHSVYEFHLEQVEMQIE